MAASISGVLGPAIGIAIGPLPIIAVILMLFSPRARVIGPVFLLGWAVTLAALCVAAYLLTEAADAATEATTTDTIGWVRIAIGSVFLLLAARQWRNRPANGRPAQMPAWLAGIGEYGAGRALGLAMLLAVNPKNLLLAFAAGSALVAAGPSTAALVVSTAVFVLVGSLSVTVAVGYYLAAGDRAKVALDSAKGWLTEHNTAVMIVLLLVLGGSLIADGLPSLGS